MDFFDHLFAKKPLPGERRAPAHLVYDPDSGDGVYYCRRPGTLSITIPPVDQYVYRTFVNTSA